MQTASSSATSVAPQKLLSTQQTALHISDPTSHDIKNLAGFVRNPTGFDVDERNTDGQPPVYIHATNPRLQIRQIAVEVEQLIRSGVPPQHIGVIARTKGALRPIEAALRSKEIQVTTLSSAESILHLTNVTWLVHCIERSKVIGRKVPAAVVKKKFPHIRAASDAWVTAEESLSSVRSSTTEGRFIECKQIYLRFFRNHRDRDLVEHTLNAWVPLCRGLESAKELLAEIEGLSSLVPITTTTIHQAIGKSWPYVFLAGATKGIFPLYLAKKKGQKLLERDLLFSAVSCATKQLRIFHAPFKHPRSRALFESPNPTLMRAAKIGLVQIESGPSASTLSAAAASVSGF